MTNWILNVVEILVKTVHTDKKLTIYGLFPSMLLRNRGRHQHKDQLKDCEKAQEI